MEVLVGVLMDIIYIVASLSFSFPIDWMAVTSVCATVEENGSAPARLVSVAVCMCKFQCHLGRAF